MNFGTQSGLTGVGLGGTSSQFFMNLILPTLGIKFSPGGSLSNLRFGFDGGMILFLTPSFSMAITPFSATAGASIHYML